MNLEQRVQILEGIVREQQAFIQKLMSANEIPLEVDQALRDRLDIPVGFTDGILSVEYGGTGQNSLTSGAILKGNGSSAVAFITPLSGSNTYYAAPSSGGSPTVGLNFTDGVLVSIS